MIVVVEMPASNRRFAGFTQRRLRRRRRRTPWEQLRGISDTAPYFHDNSAKTLEAVAAHYATFFAIVTDLDGPGGLPPLIELSDQDQTDIVAFMKLLR